ncbi:MAG TPA: ribonuclease III [Bacteroidales bacterium]|nr:ribonuclease III [Bacteroidales bacterium]
MLLTDTVKSLFSADKELSQSLKNIFGFYPGNIFLYQLAFKHKSVSSETINGYKLSNERLEYLGDAILSAVIADFLFKKFPYKNEGFLTEMRSRIVSRASLNKLSQKLGLDKLINFSNDGRSKFRSLGGDAFEAFIGALYLDKGFRFTRKIIIKRIVEMHIDLENLEKNDYNFKSKLIEWAQKEKQQLDFKMTGEIGESYEKMYVVEVVVNEKTYSSAKDFSIKGAEQLAAEKAWNVMSESGMINQVTE